MRIEFWKRPGFGWDRRRTATRERAYQFGRRRMWGMSGSSSVEDAASSAWRETPAAYLARRPPEFAKPAVPASCYVTMRDVCRLAVDVHLPQPLEGGAGPQSFPAILLFTPYYRRFKLRD